MTDKSPREDYIIRIGPLMKELLDRQIEIIKDVLHDVADPSYREAGEIIAKKFMRDL